MSTALELYRLLLSDRKRVSAYRRAIREVVRPGDIVMDLGAGTGIMGLLACQSGAERVYAVELRGMIEVVRAAACANGYGDRIVGIKGLSTRIELPEKVDVVVADQINPFGVGAGALEYFRDARRRFLKSGGTMIPSRIDLFAAPVTGESMFRRVEFWDRHPSGFDFSFVGSFAHNQEYSLDRRPVSYLAAPQMVHSFDMKAPIPVSCENQVQVEVARNAMMHGINGWFSAQLSPHVVMTNSPLESGSIRRGSSFFPIDRPTPVTMHDRIRIGFKLGIEPVTITWKVALLSRSGRIKARFVHSTLKGTPLAREDLRRTRPEYVPVLSSWGRARLMVLELSDGRRSLNEIERIVFERNRNLFPSLGAASGFVSSVISEYEM